MDAARARHLGNEDLTDLRLVGGGTMMIKVCRKESVLYLPHAETTWLYPEERVARDTIICRWSTSEFRLFRSSPHAIGLSLLAFRNLGEPGSPRLTSVRFCPLAKLCRLDWDCNGVGAFRLECMRR